MQVLEKICAILQALIVGVSDSGTFGEKLGDCACFDCGFSRVHHNSREFG